MRLHLVECSLASRVRVGISGCAHVFVLPVLSIVIVTLPSTSCCQFHVIFVEQSSGPCPQSQLHRGCFQAPVKDIFVRTVLAHPAHYGKAEFR